MSVLKNAGAIIIAKSNVPQMAMAYDSSNFIFGSTKNPWDKSRVSGGSSGGESSLIAARCSPLGIGSDIGGSIRTPSSFCGITGFKPSSTRISVKGHTRLTPNFDGMNGVKLSIGPLGKTVEDCAIMMRALLNK